MPPLLMTKPNLVIAVGDLHAGGTTAIAIPFTLADGQTVNTSPYQDWLKTQFDALVETAKQEAVGHWVTVLEGADRADGVGHHGTTQTVGTRRDQRNMAKAILRDLVSMADRAYALLGTDSHVGSNGEEDQDIADKLDMEARTRWRLNIGGKLINWAHHATLGGREWTIDNPLLTLAQTIEIQSLKRKQPVPDLILRHHVHRGRSIRATNGIRVVTCPCWQFPTSWLLAKDTEAWPDIGGVLYWPEQDRVEVIKYQLPDDPIVQVRYEDPPDPALKAIFHRLSAG